MTTPRKPGYIVTHRRERTSLKLAKPLARGFRRAKKPTAKRASAMRKAFDKQFDDVVAWDIYVGTISRSHMERALWRAFRAGAAWQRRQRRRK